TTKSIGENTGLGLSVSHGIIQHLGGYIKVKSEIGKGATFSVRLPLT
ncbi:MAG: his Kinase domain protein, partial [Nitrospirae bacterium]|nr:his Kinase domain protein [Nitrospirota bacterium]